jgi:recombination DNA repair RAD52 pathway protein
MSQLTEQQRSILLKPLNPKRVLRDNKGMSHLPAFDVVAHLTRVFGFEGWDKEILSLDLVAEQAEAYRRGTESKQGWNVTYRCTMRLTIYACPDTSPLAYPRKDRIVKVVEDGATGSANHMPLRGDAHDFAMKNSISYAIKRCAKDLGDQFGLSLYNKGFTGALLGKVVPYDTTTDGTIPDQPVPEPLSMGNDEREQEEDDAT